LKKTGGPLNSRKKTFRKTTIGGRNGKERKKPLQGFRGGGDEKKSLAKGGGGPLQKRGCHSMVTKGENRGNLTMRCGGIIK